RLAGKAGADRCHAVFLHHAQPLWSAAALAARPALALVHRWLGGRRSGWDHERRGFLTAADSDPVGAAAGSLASTSLRIRRLVVAGRPIRVCLCNRRLAGADAACDERPSRARGLSRRDPADTDGTT